MKYLRVLEGRIVKRFDDGTISGDLGKLDKFIEIAPGKYVEMSLLEGVPPILENQLKLEHEPQNLPPAFDS